MICSLDRHPRSRVTIDCNAVDRPNTYNGTPCCRDCYDKAHHDDDAAWAAHLAETDACPDCSAARLANHLRTQRTDTIDPSAPYGQHIPLTCRNHPDLFWNTKNINGIGARSIFFNGFVQGIQECDCSMNLLFSPGRFIYTLCLLMGANNLYMGD
jgi:hypothetical protein